LESGQSVLGRTKVAIWAEEETLLDLAIKTFLERYLCLHFLFHA
jgi:hypothetical protein